MKKQDVEIKLKNGLEARPIALLVQVATQFDSRIYIQMGEKRVNAKSIMGMMTLILSEGDVVTVSAEGEDEDAHTHQDVVEGAESELEVELVLFGRGGVVGGFGHSVYVVLFHCLVYLEYLLHY